jgi:putative transposase
MTQQYRRNSHTVSLVNYHLVWIPKRRKKVLVGDVEKRLRQIIWEVCQEKEWIVIALEIDLSEILYRGQKNGKTEF